MDRQQIEINLSKVKNRIAKACESHSQESSAIQLLAVSKKQSAEKICTAYELGLRDFGENYAQELFAKAQTIEMPKLQWHFIGQLQSNKIKQLVKYCASIMSVGSAKHIRLIAQTATELHKAPFPIWLQVNCGDEPQKAGVSWEEAYDLAKLASENQAVVLQGVLVLPPAYLKNSLEAPDMYKDIRQRSKGIGLGLLSMGMSHDLEIAIQAGSDMVRIGESLFGARELSNANA